ncbi:unnamed protein product [Diatraea saccharalis]|uniref:Uncharacterized protein n=1 Tax=Diatraea saccharalis TaxID=40085 RepID=A0A9N9WKL3_9NEOP|nr:unnamed protein product [Diatraea saccharalis]
MSFPNNSLYSAKLSADLRRMYQTGIIDKIVDEVRWEMQRSSTGKLLSAGSGGIRIVSVEEKGLTLEDTQGMFLLLGAGFLFAATALISEWMGGITRRCRLPKRIPSSANSQNQLLPPLDIENDVDMVTDGTESRLDFETRSSMAGSVETLDGQIINVTKENIIVHNSADFDRWDSRRSSSVDLDREVQEIFDRDLRRRKVIADDIDEVSEENREPTVSKGAFGEPVMS